MMNFFRNAKVPILAGSTLLPGPVGLATVNRAVVGSTVHAKRLEREEDQESDNH